MGMFDPKMPKTLAQLSIPGGARSIYLMNEYTLFVAAQDSGLYKIDVHSWSSPQIVGHKLTHGKAKDVFIRSKYAYVVNGTGGFQIIDISSLKLFPNYPNPFNSITIINYKLPATKNVTLAIYDVRGRFVRSLIQAMQLPGNYSVLWDGKDQNGTRLPSGIYFYRLKAGKTIKTKKLLLLK